HLRLVLHGGPAAGGHRELQLLATDGNDVTAVSAATVVHRRDDAAVGILECDGVVAAGTDDLGARIDVLGDVAENVVRRGCGHLSGVCHQQGVLWPLPRVVDAQPALVQHHAPGVVGGQAVLDGVADVAPAVLSIIEVVGRGRRRAHGTAALVLGDPDGDAAGQALQRGDLVRSRHSPLHADDADEALCGRIL